MEKSVKIQHRLHPWRNLSHKINEFFNTKPAQFFAERRLLRPNNRFLSWPNMPKRMLSVQSGYEFPPKIDASAMERFLENHKKKEALSTMLSSPPDDWRGFNVHQVLAVKKMAALIGETLAEMKLVELTHNCHKKG